MQRAATARLSERHSRRTAPGQSFTVSSRFSAGPRTTFSLPSPPGSFLTAVFRLEGLSSSSDRSPTTLRRFHRGLFSKYFHKEMHAYQKFSAQSTVYFIAIDLKTRRHHPRNPLAILHGFF